MYRICLLFQNYKNNFTLSRTIKYNGIPKIRSCFIPSDQDLFFIVRTSLLFRVGSGQFQSGSESLVVRTSRTCVSVKIQMKSLVTFTYNMSLGRFIKRNTLNIFFLNRFRSDHLHLFFVDNFKVFFFANRFF